MVLKSSIMAELWQINRARELESKSLWHEAAQAWMQLDRQDDANACITIAYAVDKGDAYREEVDRLIGECPELTPDTIKAWQKWHSDLSEIYNKHYNQ